MKVFISCSGQQCRKFGEALQDWLPQVLEPVKPYIAPADVDTGRCFREIVARPADKDRHDPVGNRGTRRADAVGPGASGRGSSVEPRIYAQID